MNLYRYAWGNNEKRQSLKNRTCRILGAELGNAVRIRFIDSGKEEVVSRYALRKVTLNLATADTPSINRFRFARGFNTCTPLPVRR